jgi:hypothetical protein
MWWMAGFREHTHETRTKSLFDLCEKGLVWRRRREGIGLGVYIVEKGVGESGKCFTRLQ